MVEHEQSSDDDSEDEEDSEGKPLTRRLDGQEVIGDDGLSKRATMFFDQDIFADIDEDEEVEEEAADGNDDSFAAFDSEGEDEEDVDMEDAGNEDSESEDEGIEIVKKTKEERWNAEDEPMKNGRPGTYPHPSLLTHPR